MFDPKQITSSMLGYAPQFVLSRFSSVIMGVIVAYGVLLTFLGQPSFFQRMGELGVVMTACYWAARGVRYGLVRIIGLVDGPEVAAAAAPVAATSSATQPSIAASAKETAAQKSSSNAASGLRDDKGSKGLD